ncbi:MAG: HAD family phosphatase [Rikenellaceae bacterium]
MVKGVIFDMDGVLVDNMAIHQEAFAQYCAQYNITGLREIIDRCSGMGNDEIMREVFPAEVIEQKGIAALAYEKEALYREIYAPVIKPVEGLEDLLKSLKERGLKIAVGSSGCKLNVEFVLRACGIEEYFDALVYEELVTKCKPDPEIYLTAISKLGLKAEECVIFEDAKFGIRAARSAKVAKVVGVATTLSA